jgi:hypothetical protein
MISRSSRRASRLGIVVAAHLCAGTALADYELYNANDTKLDLQLTVVGAQFGQDKSWFGESHDFLNASEDHWTEFGTKFGTSFESKQLGGTFFGQASGIYTQQSGDDASGLTAGLDDVSQTTLEQANLGWKTEDTVTGLEESTLSMKVGRFDYSIGTGMIITDGGSDGGDRGGWYIGMRKSFQNAGIISLDSKKLKAQVFRIKNNPRRGGAQGEGRGANVDYTFGEADAVTLGATYLRVYLEGSNDDFDTYDGRASWTALPGLTFSGEYALEDGDDLSGKGWYGQALYQFSDVPWKPALTYRYALFNDEFNTLAYGYTDYGYWFQGEIAGNYPLYNNNLKSHMGRLKLEPHEGVVVSLFYYNFSLDEPSSFAPNVTSDDFGDEVNLTVDWQATDRIYVIGVLGQLSPGDAAEQWTGGDEDWKYAMFYVSFTL